ncbi:MAG: lysine--tRNA ligase [Coprobacillus sp.]|nr:lysine--tRNA ligase [Coprobacillus sp.]
MAEETENLNDQEIARREKLPKYEDFGVSPYGEAYKVTHHSEDIRKLAGNKTEEQLERLKLTVSVAGRIMAIRRMGKASFLTIQDLTGNIQGYISIDNVGEKSYSLFKLADIGDIVGLKGVVTRTKTGELTIRVNKYTHLTKSLHPLPEKYHGLTDLEERTRRRYLDLIMNESSKKVALYRPKIIRSIQHYLDERGFTEVETSILSPILGGANARPFVTHHNTLDKDFYLRIATELNLKRLIVGGMEKVYEIGRLFRNEGMDNAHNPEFTSIEIYEAYSDLAGMRKLVEGLIKSVNKEINGTDIIDYQGTKIDFKSKFRWVKMNDLIKDKTGIDFEVVASLDEAHRLAYQYGITVDPKKDTIGYIMNEFFEELCAPELIQPTFVYCYPIETSPLTRKSKDPRFVERFELFINGREYANAYTELNDPIDQRERLREQAEAKKHGDEEANEMDTDFVEALEYGMPPTGGVGIGIDRLVMLLLNQPTIREVILFPTMKPISE